MTGAKAFGPFISDREFMEDLNIKALTMWRQLEAIKTGSQKLNDILHAQGFYPLCGWCPENRDCPKFGIENIQKDWEPVLASLDKLKDSRSSLDGEIKEIEAGLKLACENSGQDGWINTSGHRIRLSAAKGRRSLDRNLLAAKLADLFQSWKIENDTVEAFIARCEKEGAPSTRLTIQTLAREK